MITLAKFFEALLKVKAEGRWSAGLIIGDSAAVDFGLLAATPEKIKVGGVLSPAEVFKKIVKSWEAGRWVVLEIKNTLAPEIYNQLRILSLQNRLQLPSGEIFKQPNSTRLVIVADSQTVQSVETAYPDFKFLFGPVINL